MADDKEKIDPLQQTTPAKTPKTTTKDAYFQHPSHKSGTVHHGDGENWPIVDGVVRCPLEVGKSAQWDPATPEQADAYDAAVAKTEKKGKGKGGDKGEAGE